MNLEKINNYFDIFGKEYSGIYDIIYKKKNYKKECDFLEQIFKKYSLNVNNILDLGCGTAEHLILLAKRGYQITGLDNSEFMINQGIQKVSKKKLKANFYKGDILNFNINNKFDAIISMFAVMTYFTVEKKIIEAFSTIKKHIKPNGIFIFDVWHGPGILKKPLIPQRLRLDSKKAIIKRTSNSFLNKNTNTVKNDFLFEIKEKNKKAVELSESHTVRYFFEEEIKTFLRSAGFDSIACFPFLNLNKDLKDSDWYMSVVAR